MLGPTYGDPRNIEGDLEANRRGEKMNVPEKLLDIVVLVHDSPEWADLCIRAVEHFTKNPYRLILVNSASVEEKTKKLLADAESRGHTVVHLNENQSFSNGVNIGVAVGSSKFVCVLNDDFIVSEGWDSQMIGEVSNKMVGLVGARSNNAAGAQGDPTAVNVPYLVFTNVMFRREIWDKVLPMDEVTFDGFSSEDLDFSWRVLKAGLRLMVSSFSGYHAGSRTLVKKMAKQGLGDQDIVLALAKNNEKYNARLVDKWGKDWVREHVQLKPKVLVATYHAEEWTRVEFMLRLQTLTAGKVPFSHFASKRRAIQIARQDVAQYALAQGFDIVVQIDDDATFDPDLIARLLAGLNGGGGRDIITAVAYQRGPPHGICVYEKNPTPESLFGIPMEGIEHTGVRVVDVSGLHVSAYRTSVLKKMIEYREKDGATGVEKFPDGIRQFFGGYENKVGEDFAFALNLRRVGVKLYCDTELIVGHIGSNIVVDEPYVRQYKAAVAAVTPR